jgi:hypothetical protein
LLIGACVFLTAFRDFGDAFATEILAQKHRKRGAPAL